MGHYSPHLQRYLIGSTASIPPVVFEEAVRGDDTVRRTQPSSSASRRVGSRRQPNA
jgi:hypothetical protein